MLRFILFIILTLIANITIAQTISEEATSQYFETIKNNPQKLLPFLQKMPKGGDLHNHLGGASMAENLIRYGKDDQLCVDTQTFNITNNSNCSIENALSTLPQHHALYNAVIDNWSMRHFHLGKETFHYHFFAVFGKYHLISSHHSGEMLSEVVERAGEQNESYLELMITPDGNTSGMLGKKIGWNPDLTMLRKQLLEEGLTTIITNASKKVDEDEAFLQSSLLCKTKRANPGCHVKIRYLYQVLREQNPEQVFAQLLLGFELASMDLRFVGINMVQPEDGTLSMRDYKLHMQMVEFLHHLYPNVNISLHAGELVPGLVSEEGLHSHIRDAVEIGQAKRIGHGVDIRYENHSDELLNEMAQKHIMVEINLTSNADILGVERENHPLPLYIKSGVPVALSTDDEGVLRTRLTKQFEKAIDDYHFSYSTLKMLARNSITYSFIPGKSLWTDYAYQNIDSSCAHDSPESDSISSNCKAFLNSNEKASMQWELEKKFIAFEKHKEVQLLTPPLKKGV